MHYFQGSREHRPPWGLVNAVTLQFHIQKFDGIIIGQDSCFAELAPRGGRTYPMAGQVRPS